MDATVDRPIFILAPHRSGTTLLYELLADHPQLGYLNIANRRFPSWPRLAHVLTRLRIPDRPMENQVIWDRFWTTDDDCMDAKDATPRAIAWYRRYIATVLRLRRAPRFIAKYPRLSLRMAWINAVFPDALFIHLVRDWRAVVNSTLSRHTKRERRTGGKWYGMRIPGWREMSGESWNVVAGRQYRVTNQAIEAQAPDYPGRFLTIRYGTLCAEPIATLRSIADAFGLSWTADFERGIDTDLKSANYKWRETLPPESIERIRAEDPAFYAQHQEDA